MEILLIIGLLAIGGFLLWQFGQHKNKFRMNVSEVVETYDESGILIEGKVVSGWIAVSQELYLAVGKNHHHFTVVGTEINGKIGVKPKSGDLAKLMLSGKKVELIEEGSTLTTSKRRVDQGGVINSESLRSST